MGALFLSATRITWSAYAGAKVSNLRAALAWGTPSISTSLDSGDTGGGEHAHHHGATAAPTGDANPATFDAVLAIAQRVNVNTGLVEVKPPAQPGTAWVVPEIQRSSPLGRFMVHAVAIDGSTMEVVDRIDFAEFSIPAKLTRSGIDIHMGSMLGLANQLVMFLVAAGIATMVLLDYPMWRRRRPTRTSAIVGVPPRRGALRGAPWRGIVPVIAGAVLIGLWLPFVGYTLVAFVVIDTGLGWARMRKNVA